ncbi:hypothetical protein BDZ91DRAFT_32837 [Kalaharituber pfeilii]|nr:hypothetical protein BDZ91DRAFT_32837 [Kalaharituber pfeilii]
MMQEPVANTVLLIALMAAAKAFFFSRPVSIFWFYAMGDWKRKVFNSINPSFGMGSGGVEIKMRREGKKKKRK